jgi:hypothetical protein
MYREKDVGRKTTAAQKKLRSFALLMAALFAMPANASNPRATWCFPQVTWFGGAAPVMDGTIDADLGWRGGYRYIYNSATNGTPQNDAVMQGVTDGKNVYLSFEIHKPVPFSNNDQIMVAFDPDGNASHQQLFEINPVLIGQNTTGLPTGAPPQVLAYWVGSSTFSGPPISTPSQPAWVQNIKASGARLLTSDGPTDYLYTFELQIPIDPAGTNGIALPAAANFGMYLNVIRIDDATNTDWQASWPPSADPVGLDLVPPASSEWGTTSFTGACNGVSVVAGSITDTIQPGATSGTTLVEGDGTSNTFNVQIQNSTIDGKTGTPVLAPQIQPTFLIYNMGIPSLAEWAPVPSATNPPGPQDINASSPASFNSGVWTIATGSTLFNDYQQHPHQCIQVRLNAVPPSTSGSPGQTPASAMTCNVASPPSQCSSASIVTNAMVQNMNFAAVPSGHMMRGFIAEIGTKGYALPLGKEDQLFDLRVNTAAYSATEGNRGVAAVRLAGTDITVGSGDQLLWTVHGYRHLGKYLKIRGTTYETLGYAGSFGYALNYEGKSPQWRYQFFGENGDTLKSLDTGGRLFQMRIKQDKVGYVNVVFEGDAAAGTGGPVGKGGGMGGIWSYWWIILLIILLIAFLLMRRRKHA